MFYFVTICKGIATNPGTSDGKSICKENFQLGYDVTRYLSYAFLMILSLIEISQFVSKIITNEINEYFTCQNITESTLLIMSTAFFISK